MFETKAGEQNQNALNSTIWGQRAGRGDWFDHRSPLDGSLIQRTRFLSETELAALFPLGQNLPPVSFDELGDFCQRLYRELQARQHELETALLRETGFIRSDCAELVGGTLDYVQQFHGTLNSPAAPVLAYSDGSYRRQIRLASVPWGTVAVILPQNAALIIGVTCMLNGLAAGNRVILRYPTQSSLTATLMADVLQAAQPPHHAISQVVCRAKPFTQALHQSDSVLLHYMGSSRHAKPIWSEAFTNRQSAIIDGEGNVWVWVGPDANIEQTVELLTRGAIRYNGQTCTSINGVLVHPQLYEQIRNALRARWGQLRVGNPRTSEVEVGPLVDEAQAQWCEERLQNSRGQILIGGSRQGNFLAPTIVENPDWQSELVTEGLFGNALWIRAATAEEFVRHWRHNCYPLCAGVLSPSVDTQWWLAHLPSLARLSVNGDPSIEYIFEPWGGYPASGVNPVSPWIDKYRRVVAVDELADNSL